MPMEMGRSIPDRPSLLPAQPTKAQVPGNSGCRHWRSSIGKLRQCSMAFDEQTSSSASKWNEIVIISNISGTVFRRRQTMTLKDAIRVLVLGPGRQFPVIGTQSLRLLFEADDANTFNAGLRRIVSAGLLERIARGVFVNRALPDPGLAVIGDIVRNLRPRRFCYLS